MAIGLLVINMLLIGYVFFTKNKPPRHEGPKKIIAERLHFDAQQINEYNKLIEIHQEKITEKDSQIRLAKNELYGCINSNNGTLKDSLENRLGQLQIEIEKIHYNHFLDIKKLCRENQLNDFNALLKDMAQLFSKKSKDRPQH
jgi:hypothetical protein